MRNFTAIYIFLSLFGLFFAASEYKAARDRDKAARIAADQHRIERQIVRLRERMELLMERPQVVFGGAKWRGFEPQEQVTR